MVDDTVTVDIQGYDIDAEVIKAARENAKRAGWIYDTFPAKAFVRFESSEKYGFIISNPPYGERLEDKKDLPALYRQIGGAVQSA